MRDYDLIRGAYASTRTNHMEAPSSLTTRLHPRREPAGQARCEEAEGKRNNHHTHYILWPRYCVLGSNRVLYYRNILPAHTHTHTNLIIGVAAGLLKDCLDIACRWRKAASVLNRSSIHYFPFDVIVSVRFN